MPVRPRRVRAVSCSPCWPRPAPATKAPATTTERPTTRAPHTRPDRDRGGGARTEDPPEPAWIVQIGGPDADSLLGVAARDDEIVSTGYTEGALEGEAPAERDVLVAVVGTDCRGALAGPGRR